ncbi:MAG: hypothetical protein M0Q92_10155 [Methanoregula sp.]|nr:hypothetical protein [Methanoregula sp.]
MNRDAKRGERGSGRGNPHISRDSRRVSAADILLVLHAVREMMPSGLIEP